ncbi:lactate utilization protein [Cocleimonas sp. KMM 6892]|uniref:LutC/YkgG family protein n=1 Tax=unclassified Cocleimonas TaxID=2639732 RepID=UPI002DB7D539|nr:MULTISPECIES: lactate utilization protein [unclassified Cocleimonas]MEB8433123.1 lactate utilization protein [Cocleimonas sp. KMM 6892]MEC4715896.1 lactate utilization protein [Cocleimonas sp. KMM 6895]MEC4745357.1 lactate utilization protein [Cocleimonas sp. KMM 6896]
MSARDNILNRLKASGSQYDSTQELDRSWYSKHDWDETALLQNFIERMEAVRAEIHQSTETAWPELLAELCEKKGCANLLISKQTLWSKQIENQTNLPELIEYDKDIEAWKKQLFYEIDASLTTSLGGISETGSLIVWPTEDEPRMMSLVPPIHFVIMEKSKLHSTFAEAMRVMDWASQMPTNALLISGPSKSADIEQTLAYGVHGPKELVVIII